MDDEREGEVTTEGDSHVRRLVFVPVALPWLISLMLRGESDTKPVKVEGLPSNATYVGCQYDGLSLNAYLVFSHHSFEPVPPECHPPMLYVKQTNVTRKR